MSKIKLCAICGNPFFGRRDARTCSSRCRKALQRFRQQAVAQLAPPAAGHMPTTDNRYQVTGNRAVSSDRIPVAGQNAQGLTLSAMQQGQTLKQVDGKRQKVKGLAALTLLLIGSLGLLFTSHTPHTSAATSSNLNFSARLLNSSGQVVPDGNYNIEFKIYDSA